MGRNNGNTNRGGPKPQNSRSRGSPRFRQRSHFQYRVSGDTPFQPEITPEQPAPTFSGNSDLAISRPYWSNVSRLALHDDKKRINQFLKNTDGKRGNIIKHLCFGLITPNLATWITETYGDKAENKVLTFIGDHKEQISYEAMNVFSFTGKGGAILLGVVPTVDTRDKMNQDITDLENTFGITVPYRHKSLVIGVYPDKTTSQSAESALTKTLLAQGGVLLTLSGAQIT